MTARLVSPDRKLVLVAGEGDLQAVKKLCSLTSKQVGNIRQLLGWAGVGNCRGDGNDRTERKESENFMLFHSVICLKHDDRTEYVPLVGKPEHIFDSGHAPSDMNFGSKGSMRNLLNGSKAHIGRWKKGKRERCTSQPHKTPSQIAQLALCCNNSSAARGRLQRLAAHDTHHGGRRAEKGCR